MHTPAFRGFTIALGLSQARAVRPPAREVQIVDRRMADRKSRRIAGPVQLTIFDGGHDADARGK